MYRFLEEYQIPHNKCGKLIVATSGEEDGVSGRPPPSGVVSGELRSAASTGVALPRSATVPKSTAAAKSTAESGERAILSVSAHLN